MYIWEGIYSILVLFILKPLLMCVLPVIDVKTFAKFFPQAQISHKIIPVHLCRFCSYVLVICPPGPMTLPYRSEMNYSITD